MDPTEPSDSTGKKLIMASRIVRTTLQTDTRNELPQDGCHSSGWKDVKLRQMGVFTSKRPFVYSSPDRSEPVTVVNMICGGFIGHSGGSKMRPW